jgi:Ser/Thr protein kinase RdoA (MazF antagonist)
LSAKLPTKSAALVGQALATVHTAFSPGAIATNPEFKWLRRGIPWILQVHKPHPELLTSISAANYQTLRIIQSQENLAKQLDALQPLWQHDTIVHGDMKSDNILIVPEDIDGTEQRVYIVDWELIQLGDPAWDIAGALQDFVLFWINSIPPGSEIGSMLDRARFPIRAIHAPIRAFWRGYRALASKSSHDARGLLSRAIRFSGARLIQSAFERAYTTDALPSAAVLMLQLSANVLSDPEGAQVRVYGIFDDDEM